MWTRSIAVPFEMLILAGGVLACGGEDLTLPNDGARVPTTLSIVSGNEQRATVGEALPAPLVVQLADANGLPVPGATVSFQFSNPLPDAAVDPVSPATDSLGRAAASARLGSVPGDQPLQAQVVTSGQDLVVTFQLRALAKAPPGGGDQGGGGSAGPPGGDDNGGGAGTGGGGGGNGGGGNGGSGNGGSGNGGGGNGGVGDGGGGGGGNDGGNGGGHHHGKGNGKGHGVGHGDGNNGED